MSYEESDFSDEKLQDAIAKSTNDFLSKSIANENHPTAPHVASGIIPHINIGPVEVSSMDSISIGFKNYYPHGVHTNADKEDMMVRQEYPVDNKDGLYTWENEYINSNTESELQTFVMRTTGLAKGVRIFKHNKDKGLVDVVIRRSYMFDNKIRSAAFRKDNVDFLTINSKEQYEELIKEILISLRIKINSLNNTDEAQWIYVDAS